MRFSCYDWNPRRFHPEFQGIATRYSEHKKDRLKRLQQRKQLESDHIYTINLDRSLNKSLEAKTIELHKLQQAKKRHQDDLQSKRHLQEQRRNCLQQLREKNKTTRIQNKKALDYVKNQIHQQNQNSRIKLKHKLSKLNQRHKRELEIELETKYVPLNRNRQNVAKLEEISQRLQQKEKNQQSVLHYKTMIKQEELLKRREKTKMKKISKQLENINKTVEVKKLFLNQIQNQISKLKSNSKTLRSGTKIRKKTMKEQTQSSETEIISTSKKFIQQSLNPEDYSDIL